MIAALARKMPEHPISVALVTALLWGLWWVPIRWVESLGVPGAWAGVVMVGGALVLAFPAWLIWRQGTLSARGVMGAIGMGCAIMSYSAALVEGEVVRVLLIFYLAPVWSKILERVFMGVRWTWVSTVALALSFAGILALTGGTLETGVRPGDGLALVSGMAWAVGSALVFGSGDTDTLGLTWLTCAAGLIVSTLLGFVTSSAGLAQADMTGLMAGLISGALYITPLLFLTALSARWVAPGVLSFLLTAEIASGVVSSALFAGEPFGWPHAAGTALIAAGALSEVLTRRT